MQNFLIGALTAFTGAVVGGLFSAMVTWAQMRATYRRQILLSEREGLRIALTELALKMTSLRNEIDELAEDHSSDGRCICNDESCYQALDPIAQQIRDTWILMADLLPPNVSEELEGIAEVLSFNYDGYVKFIGELEIPRNACPRCVLFENLGRDLYFLTHTAVAERWNLSAPHIPSSWKKAIAHHQVALPFRERIEREVRRRRQGR